MGGTLSWKGSPAWIWPSVFGIGFLVTGFYFPKALRHFYKLWMSLALVMGSIMTRVVLVIAFSVIMTPLGWLLRISGKDLLDESIDKEAETYWKKHETVGDLEQYKKQF